MKILIVRLYMTPESKYFRVHEKDKTGKSKKEGKKYVIFIIFFLL